MNEELKEALLEAIGERVADEVEKIASGRQSDCEQAAREILGLLRAAGVLSVTRPPTEGGEAGLTVTIPWPVRGYAPGNYLILCVDCKQQRDGAKRAIRCLECATRLVLGQQPEIGWASQAEADAFEDAFALPVLPSLEGEDQGSASQKPTTSNHAGSLPANDGGAS